MSQRQNIAAQTPNAPFGETGRLTEEAQNASIRAPNAKDSLDPVWKFENRASAFGARIAARLNPWQFYAPDPHGSCGHVTARVK